MSRRVDEMTGRFAATPLMDRIFDMLDVGDCWEWKGALSRGGYGRVFTGGRTPVVHRVVWEALVGVIPEGMQLDHLCRNPRCVNPDHLQPVTPQQNVLRGATIAARNAAKSHCVNGHELAGDNVYVPPKRPARRYCRTCQNSRGRKVSRAHKENQS